jgi:hypothetical protein
VPWDEVCFANETCAGFFTFICNHAIDVAENLLFIGCMLKQFFAKLAFGFGSRNLGMCLVMAGVAQDLDILFTKKKDNVTRGEWVDDVVSGKSALLAAFLASFLFFTQFFRKSLPAVRRIPLGSRSVVMIIGLPSSAAGAYTRTVETKSHFQRLRKWSKKRSTNWTRTFVRWFWDNFAVSVFVCLPALPAFTRTEHPFPGWCCSEYGVAFFAVEFVCSHVVLSSKHIKAPEVK